jgi:hypothetical protein
LTEEDFKKETKDGNMRWKKGSRSSTERRIQKECQGKSNIQTASRGKELAIHYAPSATLIYPSTIYCGNVNKLKTRERTWPCIKKNGSTGKKGWKKWLTTQKKSDCTTEYRNEKKNYKKNKKQLPWQGGRDTQDGDGNEERRRCQWNINIIKKKCYNEI